MMFSSMPCEGRLRAGGASKEKKECLLLPLRSHIRHVKDLIIMHVSRENKHVRDWSLIKSHGVGGVAVVCGGLYMQWRTLGYFC